MALFPDVQTKAQAELDCVVGSSRLPEYEDLERMPYLRAIMMETLRWMPGLALGVPHALTADDVYNGYYLPKGTLVIAVRPSFDLLKLSWLTVLIRTNGPC